MTFESENEHSQVGINTPYGNVIVPSDFYGNDLVKSIMI